MNATRESKGVRNSIRVVSFCFLIICCFRAQNSRAQDIDTLLVSGNPVAQFSDARSIALDFRGQLYVVDAARNLVLTFDPEGRQVDTFGGAGTDEGQFDEPTDVDLTTGLLFNVSDAGNSRIQRFTKDFRFLENLPVSSQTGAGGDQSPSFRPGAGRVVAPADGFPIALASSRADDLYVIEDVSRSVLRWDRDRRNRWLIGRGLIRSENLEYPVDLAVAGDELYVADRGRRAIIVYDLFGLFVMAIAEGRLDDIVAVKVYGDAIYAILPNRILAFNRQGRLERTVSLPIPGGEKLVDAALRGDHLYLLSRRSLFILIQDTLPFK